MSTKIPPGTIYQISEPEFVGEMSVRLDLFDVPFDLLMTPEQKAQRGGWQWSESLGDLVRVGGSDDGKTATEIRQRGAPCSCPVPFGISALTVHDATCPLAKT